VRTVTFSRPVRNTSSEHYAIPTAAGALEIISAVGDSATLSYHKSRTGGQIVLLSTSAPSCVCTASQTEYLTYMEGSPLESIQQFGGYNCLDEPRSDMLRKGDGTGRATQNAACAMQTYHGGLQCCKHHFFLTDREQAAQVPAAVDTYFLKWRYYFQEYTPPTAAAAASHTHLHHWVFLIDADVNDYEEAPGNGIGSIHAHLTAETMGIEGTPKNWSKFSLYVMTPHCHAPSCIREELWNADTGEILCNVSALYGKPDWGPSSAVFNEADYVAIPPCIFGHQPGLQTPFALSSNVNITAIKYFNNTYRHLGQMAQWTGLLAYDNDPY